jgi:pheromone a factor receptor
MDIHQRHPQAVALPILSSFSIALAIPPLILHGKNRNFPATSLIFWSILLNLFNITNALIWPTDNVASWWDGAGLCDIEVKFMAAGYVGIPGSLACIFRSLAIVLDTDRATLVPSKGQRWRNQFMEILFCVAVPVIAMVTHIVWQKSRYLLFAISGCVNNFDESWVSLVFAWIWPPIICLIAAYYCCKYTPNFLHKKKDTKSTPTDSTFQAWSSSAYTSTETTSQTSSALLAAISANPASSASSSSPYQCSSVSSHSKAMSSTPT